MTQFPEFIRLDVTEGNKKHCLIARGRSQNGKATISRMVLSRLMEDHERMSKALMNMGVEIHFTEEA